MAAASRSAILSFRFPASAQAWILVQANSRQGEGEVRIDVRRQEISGFNPAHRLYERLGFRVTHEDDRKFYMKLDPNPQMLP